MPRGVIAAAIGLGVVAGTARADEPADAPDDFVFPLQLDVGLQFLVTDGVTTAGAHFGFAIVAGALTTLGTDWHVFAGLGITDTVFTRWQRTGLRAPDAVTGTHAAGLETRIGIAHGTDLGALRFVLKVTPMWVRGVDMALPTDRGPGVRASLGLAAPAWLIGLVEADAPDAKSYEQSSTFMIMFAALVPSEIEAVVMRVPGATFTGLSFGWSL